MTVFLALLVAASPSAFHAVTLMPDVSALWIGLALPLLAFAPSRGVAAGAAAARGGVDDVARRQPAPRRPRGARGPSRGARSRAGDGAGRTSPRGGPRRLPRGPVVERVPGGARLSSGDGRDVLPRRPSPRERNAGRALESQAGRETDANRREAYVSFAKRERELRGAGAVSLEREIAAEPDVPSLAGRAAGLPCRPGFLARPSGPASPRTRRLSSRPAGGTTLFMARGENLLGDFVCIRPDRASTVSSGSGGARIANGSARQSRDEATCPRGSSSGSRGPGRDRLRSCRRSRSEAALSLAAMTVLRPRGRRAPAPALFAAALLCLVYVLDLLVCGFSERPVGALRRARHRAAAPRGRALRARLEGPEAPVIGVFALALVLRVGAIAAVGFTSTGFGDAEAYMRTAEVVLESRAYPDSAEALPVFRAPGYPAFLIVSTFGHPRAVAAHKLWNAILGALTAVLLARLAGRISGSRYVAGTAGVLAAVNPGVRLSRHGRPEREPDRPAARPVRRGAPLGGGRGIAPERPRGRSAARLRGADEAGLPRARAAPPGAALREGPGESPRGRGGGGGPRPRSRAVDAPERRALRRLPSGERPVRRRLLAGELRVHGALLRPDEPRRLP